VESLLVNPGQPVRAGQPLARLHSGELLAMQRDYVAARARAGLSASRAERDAQLHAEGIIARNRLEQSQAERTEDEARLREQAQLLQLAGMPAAAVARLQAAEDMAPLLTLSARRDGIVLEQLAQVGEATEAGMPLLRLGRLAPLWLELQATREQARRINPGDVVAIGSCRSAATVVAVSPQLGEHSQTVTVRAELAQPDGCIAPNQYLEARLTPQATASDIVQIPANSLVRHQGRSFVFVRSAEGILPRQVELERRDEQIAWVSGPIAVGDAVATQGIAALKGAWQGFGVTGDP
jgi:RND family efflux transporter MFP subunit